MTDYQLIETLRIDPDGRPYLLQYHLQRLTRSARELKFYCPVEKIRDSLQGLAGSLNENCYLVRLLLSANGEFTLTSRPVPCPDRNRQISFVISDKRVDSREPLLAHKTTRRQLFDSEWAAASAAHGAGDVLFLNERDECTEGARSNLFIEREGKLLTPPLSCGLLPGTLRAHLLDTGRAVEAVLTRSDLDRGKIWLGNSVRGLQPARLVPS